MLWMLLAFMQMAEPGFQTIAQGANSAVTDPQETVIRSAGEWQALWKEHGGRGEAPAVDFAARMVAAVFLGTRPTGGYRTEVTAVRREGDALVLEYVERVPAPGSLVSQALTSPFHVVALPVHVGPVLFRRVPPSASTGPIR
jgi:hypothetical protein